MIFTVSVLSDSSDSWGVDLIFIEEFKNQGLKAVGNPYPHLMRILTYIDSRRIKNKAESRPIDASSEPPRVTQSYPESFRVTQELPRVTQSRPEPP